MKNVTVIYWSGTGNTKLMAQAVAEGAKEIDAEVKVLPVAAASAEDVQTDGALALGCPAMGAEELEEGEFEPFFSGVEGLLSGKKLALFGSYDWGDGQWMRDWQARAEAAGAVLCADGLIANNTPDGDALADCRALGRALAED